MAFERNFSPDQIKALKKEGLFSNYLRDDITKAKKTVFPAIRNGRIDFYHRGGKLFSYKQGTGFTTHPKYASVLQRDEKRGDVTEKQMVTAETATSFSAIYKRIKENCFHYSQGEALAVSQIYSRFSPLKLQLAHPVVVLDIEVSFKASEDAQPVADRKRSQQDRIDLLLFNTKTKTLRFYEAKLFENDEIRANGGEKPEVVEQIRRYRKQLVENKERIIEQYRQHVRALNELFSRSLPEPETLDTEPRLFIVGFDDDQRKGRLANNLKTLQAKGLKVYAKGDPTSIKIGSLWNGAK